MIRVWDTDLLQSTHASLKEELKPYLNTRGKFADYCSDLVVASFFKYFLMVSQSLREEQVTWSQYFK